MTPETARLVSIWLAIIGTIDSGYLLVAHYYVSVIPQRFLGAYLAVHGQGRSEILGIPIAAIGCGAYALIVAILLYEKTVQIEHNLVLSILAIITFIGFIFSMRLIWISIFKAGRLCPFCVLSAICMTLIFILTAYRLLQR
jgi:hypothetical protein